MEVLAVRGVQEAGLRQGTLQVATGKQLGWERSQVSRKSCGSEGSEWQAETLSSPRHAPTLELCPSSSLPLSSVHQLQDLAELPGARWRFYRLRVDRPERGHRVQREWGGSATWGNSSSNPSCCAPRKRGSWKRLPHKPPAASTNSRRMELRKVPSSSSGSPVLGRDKQKNSDGPGEAVTSEKLPE